MQISVSSNRIFFSTRILNRKSRKYLTGAVARWTSGQYNDYNESWNAFCSRIENGLHNAQKESAKEDVIFVFTSGGSISVVLQHVLQLSVQKTFELQLNIANCSITKLKTSSLGLRLLAFSDHAHFEGDYSKWLTYK
jgi:broad specificity phosphatase PhoE